MNLLEQIGPREIGWLLAGLAAVHAVFAVSWWLWSEPNVAALFSPKGGCTEAIVAELNRARREILIQAYSFTCPAIAQALIAAAARRIRVVVLLDRSNEAESYSELGDLEGHGMEVWIDAQHAIAHNKIIIIDSKIVITGSFNFTRQAEHENAENLLILRHHRELVARYRANFHSHREHCHSPCTVNTIAAPGRGAAHGAAHAH
jgi:phosphatidylserine/phosphatidylglycerophosphate/cardiolipin synthase-like enzyme